MSRNSKLIVVLILLFVVVLFAVVNAQPIILNLMFTKVELPLVVVMVASVLIGAVLVSIVMLSSVWEKNKKIKQLTQQLTDEQQKTQYDLDWENQAELTALNEKLAAYEVEVSDLRHQLVSQHFNEEKSVDLESNLDEFKNEM